MGFSKLKLDQKIIKALEAAGYTEPTPIQTEAIPLVIEGKDVRASAQTGTGKTAAFLLPALHLLNEPRMAPVKEVSTEDENKATSENKEENKATSENKEERSNKSRKGRKDSKNNKGARVLILTPTRELAQQITVQADKYSKYMDRIKSVCVVGGVPYHKQQAKLTQSHDILIATPGRLIDYIQRGKINLSSVEMVILDEADRMLDMGFSEPVEDILSKTPSSRQTLLFSATLEGEVLKLSKRFMNNPVEIKIHSSKEKHDNITQKLHYVDGLSHKNDLLDHILNAEDLTSAIIFTATKRHCDELVDELEEKGFYAGALHGDMNQRQRSRTIKMLKDGKINVLVATDVAARGIDIPSISHVINFDLPRDTEDYVHRIGRTGRAGKSGIAISFAGKKDVHLVPRIEKYTGQQIAVVEIKGLEPKTKPQSSNRGDSNKSGNSRFGGRGRSNSSDRDSRGSGKRSFGGRDSGRGFGGGGSDRRDSGRSDSRGGGSDRGFGGRSDSRDSGRSADSRGGRDSGRGFGGGGSDRRDSGRSDSRGGGSDRGFGGRSDSRDSGRSADSRGGKILVEDSAAQVLTEEILVDQQIAAVEEILVEDSAAQVLTEEIQVDQQIAAVEEILVEDSAVAVLTEEIQVDQIVAAQVLTEEILVDQIIAVEEILKEDSAEDLNLMAENLTEEKASLIQVILERPLRTEALLKKTKVQEDLTKALKKKIV